MSITSADPRPDGGAIRYPLKPDPYSSHAVIADEVRRLARRRAVGRPAVLDVGCGAGSLGILLGDEHLPLIGIDSDCVALEQARAAGYSVLLEADIEADELPDMPGRVDALVCADVLEHCRHPEQVLRRLLGTYVNPGGAVIVSLPNVAHWYVRAQLFAGRWRYADRGILDRTHVRFFTAESSAALLAGAGVVIRRRHPTPLPLPVLYAACRPGGALYGLHAMSARVTRLRPTLLAYQFVYVGTWHGFRRICPH